MTNDAHLVQDTDLYDDVITTQSSSTDFTDITNTVNQNHVKLDQSNGSTGRSTPSNSYNGKRVSLYVGQLTWVCHFYENNDEFLYAWLFRFFTLLVDNRC